MLPDLNDFKAQGYDFEVEKIEEKEKLFFDTQMSYDENDDEVVEIQVKHVVAFKMRRKGGELKDIEKLYVIKDWMGRYKAEMTRARRRRDLRRALKRALITTEETGIWVSDNMNRQYREANPEKDNEDSKQTGMRMARRTWPDDVVSEGKILAEKKRLRISIK